MSTPSDATRTLTVFIASPPSRVYDFVYDARNLPSWAFFETVTPAGDDWLLDTPHGPLRLRFVPKNADGVLDHTVKLHSGVILEVPLRVVPSGEGSEVRFTLLRTPDMSDAAFETDAKQVATDLAKLKAVIEAQDAAGH